MSLRNDGQAHCWNLTRRKVQGRINAQRFKTYHSGTVKGTRHMITVPPAESWWLCPDSEFPARQQQQLPRWHRQIPDDRDTGEIYQ